MKTGAVLATMALLLMTGACTDNADPDNRDEAITGRVVDADGRAVAGAAIVLQYEDPLFPGSTADKPRHGIQFVLPEPGRATVWVASYCDGDTMRMLMDDVDLPSGEFNVIWDDLDDRERIVPDGVYWFHVVLPTGATRTAFLWQRSGYGDLQGADRVAALGMTDVRGTFVLSQDCLPFGHVFTATDEGGQPVAEYEVTRRVRVWALHPDFAVAGSDWVTVDEETGVRVGVTLVRP